MKKITMECGMLRYTHEEIKFSTEAMGEVLKLGKMGYTKVYNSESELSPIVCTPEQYEILKDDNAFIAKVLYTDGSPYDSVEDMGYLDIYDYMEENAIPEELAVVVTIELVAVATADC